ncbi:MAG: hypothetical protein D6727_07035 [Gammaproteobacteria bacterium]|nr:MAG: hypothetical protein D6727_07035 [Gammaproteobacteria bacterium]
MQPASDAYNAHRAERRFSRWLLWLVFAGSTAGTLIALAARWHWVAELFSHYRFHYLLAQALLLLVFLNTRRPGWLALTLLLALPNAWYVGPYLLPVFREAVAGAPRPARAQLLAVNLSFRNHDYQAMLDYLRASRPELMVLSEYTPAWHAALSDALADYPYRVLRPRRTPFGIAVYSRRPLRQPEVLDLGAPGAENLRLRVDLAGQPVELYAVHLYSPASAQRAAWRRTQLRRLAAALRDRPYPRLVVGDLNLTPFSPLFTDLLRDSGLMDARRRAGLHVTWPASPLPLWIPIDHCLADVAAGVVSVRAGPDLGSDHFPLEVSLADVS